MNKHRVPRQFITGDYNDGAIKIESIFPPESSITPLMTAACIIIRGKVTLLDHRPMWSG
jgi:hypothetical protein